jgi:hypothetical protein
MFWTIEHYGRSYNGRSDVSKTKVRIFQPFFGRCVCRAGTLNTVLLSIG